MQAAYSEKTLNTGEMLWPQLQSFIRFVETHHAADLEAFLHKKGFYEGSANTGHQKAMLHEAARLVDQLAAGGPPDTIGIHPTGSGSEGDQMSMTRTGGIPQGALLKEALLHFLPRYSGDVETALDIVKGIDLLIESSESNAVSVESQLLKRLQLREEQLLEAQAISGIGSFVWDVDHLKSEVTPELLRILEIDNPDDFEGYLTKIHPGDQERVKEAIGAAVATLGDFDCRYRYHTASRGECMLWSRGKVTKGADGPVMKGTVTDITEHQTLVHRFRQSERLYKEAQAMAHIGNWSLDLTSGEIHWSDEIYRIYGLEPGAEPLTADMITAFTNPSEIEIVAEKYRTLLQSGAPYFHIGRIKLRGDRERTIEVKARVESNEEGVDTCIIGTIQDVSNEQELIRRLQQDERLYKQVESLAHIGSWVYDLQTRGLTWSEEMYRIYGVESGRESADLSVLRAYVHEEDRERTQELIAQCMTEGTPYEYQYRITLPDGTVKLLRGKGEALLDEKRKAYCLFGTVQDITQEQELLRQLQRSETLYKQAQSIAKIGNWMYDVPGDRIEWSDEIYRIYEASSGKGARNMELVMRQVLPLDKAVLTAHMKRCMDSGHPFDCHYRIRMKDGSIKNLRAKGEALPDKHGKTVRLFGTIQDITEQMEVEKRLRENQRFTQKITDIAPSIIAVYNIQTGKYLFISQAVEKLLGYTSQQIGEEGVAFFTGVIHPDDLGPLMAKNTEAVDTANAATRLDSYDDVAEFKYRMRHRDGAYRWFQTYGTIFDRDEEGKVLHVLNISIDITAQEQAEQALNQKNLLLQQSNSSLEEFAYIASHDLQEPLRKISTFGNMLQTLQEEDISESGKLYLRKIVDSSLRMQGMINDLLSVSVISGNKSFAAENLQDLLGEALQTLDHKMELTGAVIDVPLALPEVHVIASQFRQLFQNLVGNSLKFIREGVPPHIRITYEYLLGEDAVRYGLDSGGRYLKLMLEDNGIGFSNNYAGKIFSIFQRLHGRSEYEGTGIGLAICKKIVEHHKGVIYASGEPGVGAVFTVVVPV